MNYDYLAGITVYRFLRRSARDTRAARTLRDYITAIKSTTPQAADKASAPAWALCNDTGDGAGTPTGLIQIDFDDVADVPRLRALLAAYGGFLAVHRSFGGRGVVAIGYAGPSVSADPERVEALVYAPVRAYLRACGVADGDYRIDPACAKPCQLRFEARDPRAWVSPRFARLCADPEDDAALAAHPVAALADALFPPQDGATSPAGLAAALTCIGMTANLRSRMTTDAAAYAARAFCVIIGEPGCGKTTLLGTVQDVARRLGVVVSDPKNAPTLREHILACGCDEVVEQPEPGERGPVKRKLVERTGNAIPLVVCVDEAGQRMRTRVQDESCGSLAAMLRQCNGEKITLEATVKQDHCGSYRVPAHISVLLGTTMPQWAEYAAGAADNGEARRIAEFLQPASPVDMFAAARTQADVDGAVAALRRLHEMASLWADAGAVFEPAFETHAAVRSACAWLASGGVDAPSAQSLVMCYATLCAGLRASVDGAHEITVDDIGACMCILRRVLDARAGIAAACDKAGLAAQKSDGAVWAEIMGWIEKTPRRDKVLAKIVRRPTQYRRVYDQMVAARSVVVTREGDRYILRVASADELEADAEKRELARTPAPTPTPLAAAYVPVGSAPAYASCPAAEREERALAYITQFRQDNPLTEGTRNNSLSRLAYRMQAAGMWDATARTMFATVARQSGLGEAEIRTLMRERKILQKS